jgi:hypothetical protein
MPPDAPPPTGTMSQAVASLLVALRNGSSLPQLQIPLADTTPQPADVLIAEVNTILYRRRGKAAKQYPVRGNKPEAILNIFRVYTDAFAKICAHNLGLDAPTEELRVRVWYGGPHGWWTLSAARFWEQVQACLPKDPTTTLPMQTTPLSGRVKE